MSDVTVVVYPREETGKGANGRLRVAGSIPAVVYGGGKESVAIKVDEKTMHEFLKHSGTENSVFLLKLGDSGKSRHAMIRDLQIDTIAVWLRRLWAASGVRRAAVPVATPAPAGGAAFPSLRTGPADTPR